MLSRKVKPEDVSLEKRLELFNIHNLNYNRKGKGHSWEIWNENLNKSYHGKGQKTLYLYEEEETGNLQGYILSQGPLNIDGDKWEKIIETGIHPDVQNKSTFFVKMMNFLKDLNLDHNYFIEISIDESKVRYMREKFGFKVTRDQEEVKGLLLSFLSNSIFDLIQEEERLIVKRKTAITENLKAEIFIYKALN